MAQAMSALGVRGRRTLIGTPKDGGPMVCAVIAPLSIPRSEVDK
jgi:hypothetical protein